MALHLSVYTHKMDCRPPSAQPTRMLVHRRDQLALKLLDTNEEVKSIRSDQLRIGKEIERE